MTAGSGGRRLMEPEAHPLVVSAESEPSETWFLRARIVGLATKLTDGTNGGADVGNGEEDVDAALLVLVVEAATDGRRLDPRLVAIAHRVKGPRQQLPVDRR